MWRAVAGGSTPARVVLGAVGWPCGWIAAANRGRQALTRDLTSASGLPAGTSTRRGAGIQLTISTFLAMEQWYWHLSSRTLGQNMSLKAQACLRNHAIKFQKLTSKKVECLGEEQLKKQVSTLEPISIDYLTFHTLFFSCFIENIFPITKPLTICVSLLMLMLSFSSI